jgi:hypothetical protein
VRLDLRTLDKLTGRRENATDIAGSREQFACDPDGIVA